jgi:hypothetical protein
MAIPIVLSKEQQTVIHAAVALANDCIDLAEDVYDAALDLHTEFSELAARVLARAAQSLISVAELAQRGLVGDAMSVARTIVELTIDLGYIASDPDTLVRRFVDYADVRQAELAEATERLHKGGVDQEAMRVLRQRRDEYLEENPNSKHNWATVGNQRRGVGWRAAHVAGDETIRNQYIQLYELLYGDMCDATHSGAVTLQYTMQRRPDGTQVIHFGPQVPDAKPIRLSVLGLLQMTGMILRTCAIPGFDDRFNKVQQALTPQPHSQ